jgi:hypothetical protein
VPRPFPCGTGDTRRAALRPSVSTPVLVTPTCVGLPNRDAEPSPHHPACAEVRSEDWRARVEGPSEGRVIVAAAIMREPRAYALWRMPTSFPSSASSGHPLSSARPLRGRIPRKAADRPRPSFRRRPAKSAAFQTARMPFTVTDTKDVFREGMAPSGLSFQLSRSRRPHFFPGWGQCFVWALQGHGAVTRGSVISRVQTPFLLVGTSVPGIDDPSTPPRSSGGAVDEGSLPRSHHAGRSA